MKEWTRQDALNEIALHLQRQLDNHAEDFKRVAAGAYSSDVTVTDDFHIYRFNPLVSRGQLKEWIKVLTDTSPPHETE